MNEKSFGERLRALREREKLSVKEVIDKLEKYGQTITDKTLYSYESNKRAASADMLLALCQIYHCTNILETFADIKPDYSIPDDSEWNMIEKYRFISQNSQAGKETVDYVLNKQYEIAEQIKLTDERITKLESKPSTIIEFQSDSETPKRILQYFHSVSAGTGQVIFDDVYSERVAIPDIPEYGRVSYAVKVSGHSMEPLYYDGDMLLIEPTCEVGLGEIGIFIVGNEAFVKKLGDGELISLNKGYDNIPLTADSKCMGRVVDRYIVETE